MSNLNHGSFATRQCLQIPAVGLSLILWAGLASGSIITGSVTGGSALGAGGTFVELTPPLANPFGPPNSVGNDTFQSPNLFGFDEDQNILLAAPLPFDTGGFAAAGTVVASHYVFFDPGPIQTMLGTVDFDSTVLGIISSTGLLFASDFLANTGVNYLNPAARGLEAGDAVFISGAQQISFDVSASTPGDYVRVITAFSPGAVPEPGTLFLVGLGAIFAARKLRHS